MSTVFVTGGSGFVGGRLIARLVRDGHTVRALARSETSAATVRGLGAQAVSGDMADVASLRSAAQGCELAFHSAARTTRGGTKDQFRADNVEGTANVLRACREAGVRRVVHVSSEAALMAGQALVDVDENAPLRPDSPAAYPATKAEAEKLVLDANTDGFETVVVRPRFVWGAGDTTVLPELVALVRAKRFAWVGGGRHRTDTTHVDNVVEGLCLAATKGRPGEVYFVTDDEPVVFRDFITELLATQGVTAPGRSLPRGLASVVAGTGEMMWQRLHLTGAPPVDYMSFWMSSQQCTIDITKARTELGYQPVRTHAAGLAELRG